MCFFSATLHSPQIKELAEKICVNPTWVDLKGFESVPETVHHVLYRVDPLKDKSFLTVTTTGKKVDAITDGVHTESELTDSDSNPNALSEGVKQIKPFVLLKLIDKYQVIILVL